MTPAHGIRAVLVAGATAVAGDHSILTACIVAGSGVAVALIGPILTGWISRKWRPSPMDHHQEVIAEQRALLDHYLAELAELRGENRDLENENKQLRRRRD